jgi:hypothetical protein
MKIHPVDLGRRSRFERLKLKQRVVSPQFLRTEPLADKISNLLQGERNYDETPDLRRHGLPYGRARRARFGF